MKKLLTLTSLVLLPTIYGCGGGGSSLLGSLFGGGSIAGLLGGGGGAAGGAGAAGGGIGSLALVNPEPTTMLLLGSGVVAMGYFKNKKK